MIHNAGKIPAHPCIPAVVQKLATVLAVAGFTPSFLVNVSTVNGNTPILERDVKAKINASFALRKYIIGLTPNSVNRIACTTNITATPT